MTTLRAPTRFEKDVMRRRPVIIAASLAAIAAGITAFVIGLRQPIEPRAQLDVDAAAIELAVHR